DDLEGELSDRWSAQEVVVMGFKYESLIRIVRYKLVGACTDWCGREFFLADPFGIGARENPERSGTEAALYDGIWFSRRHVHGGIVNGFDASEGGCGVSDTGNCVGALFVHHALDRINNVIDRERRTVVEKHIIAEIQLQREVVNARPVGGDHW